MNHQIPFVCVKFPTPLTIQQTRYKTENEQIEFKIKCLDQNFKLKI